MRRQLHEYGGDDPVWGLVALLRDERFSGRVVAGTEPRVRLFAADGRIYFAEREDAAPLSARLVELGALSAEQLARGMVSLGGTESLARLFQRDPSIDRDVVEMAVVNLTEHLLATVANVPAGRVELRPLQHHPAGIHLWHAGEAPQAPLVAVEEEPSVADAEPTAASPAWTMLPPLGAPVAADPPAAPPPVAVVDEAVAVVDEPVAPVDEPVAPVDEPVTEVPALPSVLPSLAAVPTITPLAPMPEAPTPSAALIAGAFDLPKLADKPFAVNDIRDASRTGTVAEDAVAEEAPVPEPPATDTTPVAKALLVVGAAPAMEAPDADSAAAAVTPMADPAPRPAPAEPVVSWSSSSHNLAAVEIWEMVDELLGEPRRDDQLVAVGPEPKSGRGWRRGRKG